jgi:hypothetical protein
MRFDTAKTTYITYPYIYAHQVMSERPYLLLELVLADGHAEGAGAGHAAGAESRALH